MQKRKRRKSDRAGRPALHSPGRPSVARREERQEFWKAIALGLSSEDAAVSYEPIPASRRSLVSTRRRHGAGGLGASVRSLFLSFAEREEIAILKARGAGVRDIARRLGRAPSTVSRELRRNAATRGGGFEYRASTAQWHSDWRAKRPKKAKLAVNDRLRSYVQQRLAGAVMTRTGAPSPARKQVPGRAAVTKSVAAGHQREHQWSASPVLSEGHRSVQAQRARFLLLRWQPHSMADL